MIKDKTIFIKNIYYMLAYAFRELSQDKYAQIGTEKFEDMHNLMAAILARGISLQLKQGLYREYIGFQEDLPVLHGKINIRDTIRNRMANKQVLNCEFDELSENNLFNQILKTTVLLLLKHARVNERYKDILKKSLLFLDNVDTVEPKQIRWGDLRFQRNNKSYRMLLSICQLILEGMIFTTEAGDIKLTSFIDEQRMCALYEKFILEYYKQNYPELSVKAAQIPWALDNDMGTMLPIMQSDIAIQKDNTVLIIDAKYYSHTTQAQYNKHTIHSHNLYQIFTYVKNKEYSFDTEEHKVSGMLLYAKTEEEIQPDNAYMFHGNKIMVKTLDLNQEFKYIAEKLDKIIEQEFYS